MHSSIQVRTESKRGCGYRAVGGLYLVSGISLTPCGRLPIPLTTCPTCSAGIKPSRGWTWIDTDKLVENITCKSNTCSDACPLYGSLGRAGLLWIGAKFYSTTDNFMQEAIAMGVSRRISAIPNDFVLGETWILLAHQKAIRLECVDHLWPSKDCNVCDALGMIYFRGIFHAFKPTAIEKIVTGEESDEEIEALIKRGITPVKAKRTEQQGIPAANVNTNGQGA